MVAGPIGSGSSGSDAPVILGLPAPFWRHPLPVSTPAPSPAAPAGVSPIPASGGTAPAPSSSVPPPSEPLEGSALRR